MNAILKIRQNANKIKTLEFNKFNAPNKGGKG